MPQKWFSLTINDWIYMNSNNQVVQIMNMVVSKSVTQNIDDLQGVWGF